MTFGDIHQARILAAHYPNDTRHEQRWGYNAKRAPKGFVHLGTGCSRSAFLHRPTGLVYKIGSPSANLEESSFSRMLRKKSQSALKRDGVQVVIPHTRTFLVPGMTPARYHRNAQHRRVAVQEFAKDARPTYCAKAFWYGYGNEPKCTCRRPICNVEVLKMIEQWANLCDVHYGNVLVDADNRYWIIDMGAGQDV